MSQTHPQAMDYGEANQSGEASSHSLDFQHVRPKHQVEKTTEYQKPETSFRRIDFTIVAAANHAPCPHHPPSMRAPEHAANKDA